MSALAEALLAAQRQAIGALSKAYVAGTLSGEELFNGLDSIGLRDAIDQGLLVNSLGIVKEHGGEAPRPTGQTNERKAPEQPTPAQLKFIRKLCDEKSVPMPDVIVSSEQASDIITALKAGTYDHAKYDVPF